MNRLLGEFSPRAREEVAEVSDRDGEAQAHALAVGDEDSVRRAGVGGAGNYLKRSPKEWMPGIDYFHFLGDIGRWVLEGGINNGDRDEFGPSLWRLPQGEDTPGARLVMLGSRTGDVQP